MVINHCLPWWTSDSSKEASDSSKEEGTACALPRAVPPTALLFPSPLTAAAGHRRRRRPFGDRQGGRIGGGLDILVNNAGIGAQGTVLDSAPDPAAERAALEARQPHGRLVSADEVAHAVLYLASPRAGSTTGAEIAVDGGMAGLRLRPRT